MYDNEVYSTNTFSKQDVEAIILQMADLVKEVHQLRKIVAEYKHIEDCRKANVDIPEYNFTDRD